MGQFFKGWRRKAGAVTLVVACVFMAGWVRSLYVEDCFYITTSHRDDIVIFSDSQITWWGSSFNFDVKSSFKWTADTQMRFGGWVARFMSDGNGSHEGSEPQKWILPYWSIVFPLIAISLWLLLSNPRNSNQKKTPVSTAGEEV